MKKGERTMDERIQTNPPSYHSTMLFPRNNKNRRAGLESQEHSPDGITSRRASPVWRGRARGSPVWRGRRCWVTPAAPHRRLFGRGPAELAPRLWRKGGKGLQSLNHPSSVTVHGRARDTDLPGLPTSRCRLPPPAMLASSLQQSRLQSPRNRARALRPATIHTMATQAVCPAAPLPPAERRIFTATHAEKAFGYRSRGREKG